MPPWVQTVKQGRASPIGTTMHISLLQQPLATEKSEKGSERLKAGLFMVKKGIIILVDNAMSRHEHPSLFLTVTKGHPVIP
jgi:hypothetical protein